MLGDALQSELGASRRATKTVMGWTGVCDRAARNWINGSGGVSGVHLLQLARQSDAVWRMVIGLSSREEAILSFDIHAVEVAMSRALGSIEAMKRQAIASSSGRRGFSN
jgi:hypothetical protein